MADGTSNPFLSARLEAFLEELTERRAINAGRFCANCYTPLPAGYTACDFCGQSIAKVAPLDKLPPEIIELFRVQRKREGTAVRLVFYSTLFLGIIISATLIPFLPFWWNMAVFLSGLGVSYVASANIANTLGDAIGYRWGQRAAEEHWQRLLDQRRT